MSLVFTIYDIVRHAAFFLNSFMPLWIVLLAQLVLFNTQLNQIHYFIAIAILSCFIIGPAILVYFSITYKENMVGETKITIIKNNDVTGEYAIYFITYIIAFISGDFFTDKQMVTFGIVFIFFGILYIKHNMLYINPFISMLGYKFHRVQTDEDNDVNILSRKASLFSEQIRINQITRGFYIESKTNSCNCVVF